MNTFFYPPHSICSQFTASRWHRFIDVCLAFSLGDPFSFTLCTVAQSLWLALPSHSPCLPKFGEGRGSAMLLITSFWLSRALRLSHAVPE